MRAAHLVVASIVLLPVSACASDDIAKVTDGFYAAYLKLPHDGIPDEASRTALEPFITPALDKLLIAGENAEARYAKATNNQSPPIIEGDLFSSLFEGATAYKVGACKESGNSGTCPVALTYRDKSAKPAHWTDTVTLVRTQQGWRIDDIAYGGTWDFGNKGKLTETLKFALTAAAEPQQ